MARYIDADALLEDIQQKYCSKCDMYDGLKCKTCELDDTIYYLENAPTADIANVVRCKDCEHWTDTSSDAITEWHWGECRKPLGDYRYCETAEHDFCSYGERKE